MLLTGEGSQIKLAFSAVCENISVVILLSVLDFTDVLNFATVAIFKKNVTTVLNAGNSLTN